ACHLLQSRGAPFTCHLVGAGPLRPWLERQIARHGLADQVQLEGPRHHDQLPDWYQAADLFILPSRSEGVPTVLLEAAACGTPWTATSVGGIPEIACFGTNRLVPPDDAAALAEAIAAALAGLFTGFERGPVFVRSHTEAAFELAKFLDQVCRTRGRPT